MSSPVASIFGPSRDSPDTAAIGTSTGVHVFPPSSECSIVAGLSPLRQVLEDVSARQALVSVSAARITLPDARGEAVPDGDGLEVDVVPTGFEAMGATGNALTCVERTVANTRTASAIASRISRMMPVLPRRMIPSVTTGRDAAVRRQHLTISHSTTLQPPVQRYRSEHQSAIRQDSITNEV